MTDTSDAKVCAITGPTRGIGLAIAERLSAKGYHLLLLCRDLDRGRSLQSRLLGSSQVLHCDLADPASIVTAARAITEASHGLDVLINNAGILETRKRRVRGVDAMMAVNHVGHFLLTQWLLPLLQQAASGRVVVTSSIAHRLGRLKISDPLAINCRASGLRAYAQSKLANLLFMRALSKRLEGSPTVCNAVHPGIVLSHLILNSGSWIGALSPMIKPFVSSASNGARSALYLATAAQASALNGQYLDQRARIALPAIQAYNLELQEALWLASENAVEGFLPQNVGELRRAPAR